MYGRNNFICWKQKYFWENTIIKSTKLKKYLMVTAIGVLLGFRGYPNVNVLGSQRSWAVKLCNFRRILLLILLNCRRCRKDCSVWQNPWFYWISGVGVVENDNCIERRIKMSLSETSALFFCNNSWLFCNQDFLTLSTICKEI